MTDLQTLEPSPMAADLQTRASPEPSSDSTKKRRRKKKSRRRKGSADDLVGHEGEGGDGAAASEPMDVTVEASTKKDDAEARDSASDSTTHSAEKRKKRVKTRKRKAAVVDDPVGQGEGGEEQGGVAPEPTDGASSKKENKPSKKKHKAAAGHGQEEEEKTVTEPTDGSYPKKENKPSKKKHKAAADHGQKEEEKTVTAPEPVSVTLEASTTKKLELSKKPKAGATNVTVDASLAGGSAASRAPVVGYFPTGYNPLSATRSGEAPSARLFRNTKHPSRVDLVVRSPGGGPDFVGRSYAGEAALPQLCNYALGVLDKASGTLKIVPIASDKILRLEPYLEVQKPSPSQQSGVTSEAASAVAAGEMRVQDLTSMYGAKKDKDQDKKWKSLNEQTNDPSAFVDLDLGKSETNANTSENEPVIVRNIPPYDPTADTSEKAYLFHEIIPKNIRSHLLEILGHLESGEFSSKGYGSFVSNRVQKLEKLQGEDKERLAWILSYITHLLTLMERSGSMSKGHRRDKELVKAPVVPQAVYRHMMIMFTDEGSSTLSTEKKELLISYILVLTLFADDFRTDPADILADLKMTRAMLKPYYDQLGCKAVSTGAFKSTVMTLPAPLKFPKDLTKRRRRRG